MEITTKAKILILTFGSIGGILVILLFSRILEVIFAFLFRLIS